VNVFLTGGTGFVGKVVLEALLARNHSIHALVNHRPVSLKDDRVQSFPGGLFDDAALDRAMSGCGAVIHLVGIIAEKPAKGITFDRIHSEGTERVVAAARRAGIQRYLHMSALGAGPNAPARYHRSKFKAEQHVRGSGLDWTIFQPSLIHGPGGDFSKMEAGWATGKSLPFFFMPYFGAGVLGMGRKSKIQPIFVEDVARAFAEALEDPGKVGEVFPMGGPEQMTWPRMHQIAAEVLNGKRRRVLPIPGWYAKAIARLVPAALLPFTRDQVLMSEQDNVCDLSKFVGAFGWTPGTFAGTLRSYAS
jgi:NADH dehydrogenase